MALTKDHLANYRLGYDAGTKTGGDVQVLGEVAG
jgi:hypothetical protein